MLALLRYRRIPYHMIWGDVTAELVKRDIPVPQLPFLPTFLYQDEAGSRVPRSDSTPIIRELEQAFTGRSVLPEDPALAFIDYLLEDFADEWGPEKVVYVYEPRCGLKGIVVVDNSSYFFQ